MMIFTKNYGQDMLDPKHVSYRPPTAVGTFYPSDPDSLRNMIMDYIDTAGPRKIQEEIIGMVAPHAGYVFSGKVAGKAYRELLNRKYESVIIVAPSHYDKFAGASVFDGDAYITPLGEVNVDKELAKEIADVFPSVKLSRSGHSWNNTMNEHSLEVQLPFLQVVLPGVPIVPIVMGTQNFHTSDQLMRAMVSSIRKLGRNVLIIASSDMSHFHDRQTARSMDITAGRTFGEFDYFQLGSKLFSKDWEACGAAPIVTVMMAAEQLGANVCTPVSYMTSAESEYGNHDTNRVVGYLSGIMSKNDNIQEEWLPDLTEDDTKQLLDIAKSTVAETINGNEVLYDTSNISKSLKEKYAAFVTLRKEGSLRACMGHIYPSSQLIREVRSSARIAATSDYRFGAVTQAELDSIDYEITILSRFKRVLDTNEIEIGRDGLYIMLGDSSGLLLPQVASERNWDRKTFLESLCNKAGLSRDSYLNPNAELYIFRARIIEE